MPTQAPSWDARLIEDAVLHAIGQQPREQQARFHRERDSIYSVGDPEAREARFQEFHGRWFVALALDDPLGHALTEQPALATRALGCRVVPARARVDEGADLVGGNGPPLIAVRLRPESLLDRDALLLFLRHELAHVADMLDPEFGYERELPLTEAGPSYDNLMRNRYHVVWDAAIDGRLCRRELLPATVRGAREGDFARAFPMLAPRTGLAFSHWFDHPKPTHSAIVRFIFTPTAGMDSLVSSPKTQPSALGETPITTAGRCPICRFPTAARDVIVARLPGPVVEAIRRSRPEWHPEEGLCRQCADLYECRYGDGTKATAE